ncbi:hypothetical protein, partial [Acinetobacter tandoii]|uniref:hypothetical protein n=1 Tax=Acinetobacter tandoii TaxID=202954 RepID=UPI003018C997
VTLTATKAANGTWSLDSTPTGVSIDPSTGVVSIGRDAVKDGSVVTAIGTDPYNNTASDNDTALADDLTPNAADAPDVLALAGGAVSSTPGADNIQQVISYTDESNTPVTLTATKAANGTWSLDSTPTGVSIDPSTGVVSIGRDA